MGATETTMPRTTNRSRHLLESCQAASPERRQILRLAAAYTGAFILTQMNAPFAQAAERSPGSAPSPGAQPMFAYVGSRTTRERNAHGDGITVYKVDVRSGDFEFVQLVSDLVNPSFLALSHDGEFLYTVHGDESEVSAFKVDRNSGRLAFLNRQGTQGKNPVHLALDPTGRYLVVSNHLGSSLAVLPVESDGSLGALSQLVTLSGPIGPHRVEQKQAKPHCNAFDPSGRFVVVPDKGLDRIFVFRFSGGMLTPAASPFVATREGAGPRHLAFHPKKDFAYAVNELDSSVTTYRFHAESGALEPLQILSTLPSRFTGNSRAAEIAVDREGRTLYASNRGHDSIASFRIDPATGLLEFVGADLSLGRTPRFFALLPDGRRLFALNEESDSIVGFHVDAATGRLSSAGTSVKCGSPVCMLFSD
jgi:6-phosphogluconolactonase (cycloisomerase 2 family)